MNNDYLRNQQVVLKSKYDSCCNNLKEYINNPKDKETIQLLDDSMNCLFFELERTAADSHSLFDTDHHDLGKWFADTSRDAMIALVSYDTLMKRNKKERYFSPSGKALASMQSLVKKYLDKNQVDDLINLLEKNSITTEGFNEKNVFRMTKSLEKIISYICSGILIITILTIAILIPNPSGFQYTIFRIILALSAGGFAAFFSGFLEVQFSKTIKAGSGFAVFIVVYLMAPAAIQ